MFLAQRSNDLQYWVHNFMLEQNVPERISSISRLMVLYNERSIRENDIGRVRQRHHEK